MTTVKKRKKINVRTADGEKSVGNKIEIDLKSAVLEEIAPAVKKEPEKIKTNPTLKSRPSGSGPQLGIYRKIAFSFIVLTVALLGIIFYFSFIKLTITVVPKTERISGNLIFDIRGNSESTGKNSVLGAVESVDIEEISSFPATGSEIIGEEVSGKAVITNNYNRSQPLVATTRLLSADNKLFRTKNTVNVPAGGSVEVEIYADNPGAEMAIGPAKFTIPGLWAGLQDKIYAESSEAMKYSQNAKKTITQPDIDNGLVAVRKNLIAKAEAAIGESYKNYAKKVYEVDENSVNIEIDGKIGEEKKEFSVTMKASVVVAAFNEDEIKRISREELSAEMPANKELKEFGENTIVYSLNNYNLNNKTAAVSANFAGTASPNADNIIDREKILGVSADQLKAFLDDVPEIASYEIKFSPSFINKAPKLADRIKIIIKN